MSLVSKYYSHTCTYHLLYIDSIPPAVTCEMHIPPSIIFTLSLLQYVQYIIQYILSDCRRHTINMNFTLLKLQCFCFITFILMMPILQFQISNPNTSETYLKLTATNYPCIFSMVAIMWSNTLMFTINQSILWSCAV